MADVAVIGAGPMGLSAGLELLKAGHRVTVYEADSVIGGMSASFDFEGLRIERFYHFICRTDEAYFEHLHELGIHDSLRWVNTRMGYFHDGQTKNWGTPWALLTFPGLGLIAKLRYGLMAFFATRRKNWQDLDGRDAVSWIKSWVGEEGWRELWQQLFELKFHHFTENLSAAWIWARMRRVGQSRKNLFTEQLGYLEGGSDTWLQAVGNAIEAAGGVIRLSARVDEVLVEDGAVAGVRCGDEHFAHQVVISTIPLPFVSQMIPALPTTVSAAYRALENIAVVCVLAKLKRPLSPYFWMNVSDASVQIPGVIEYSNLRPLEDHVVYVPYYLPGDHADYQRPDEWFVQRSRDYLLRLNPALQESDILKLSVGRYRYAQPICPPGFPAGLPPVNTVVRGLCVADTSYYYPEDRSISESIALGIALASTAFSEQARPGSGHAVAGVSRD